MKRSTIDLKREEALLFICVTWRRRVVDYPVGLVFVNVTGTRRREGGTGRAAGVAPCVSSFSVFHIFVRVVVRRITHDTQRSREKLFHSGRVSAHLTWWENILSFLFVQKHMELEYRQYRESSYVRKENFLLLVMDLYCVLMLLWRNIWISRWATSARCFLFFFFFLFLVSIIGFFSSTVIEFISAVIEFFI